MTHEAWSHDVVSFTEMVRNRNRTEDDISVNLNCPLQQKAQWVWSYFPLKLIRTIQDGWEVKRERINKLVPHRESGKCSKERSLSALCIIFHASALQGYQDGVLTEVSRAQYHAYNTEHAGLAVRAVPQNCHG